MENDSRLRALVAALEDVREEHRQCLRRPDMDNRCLRCQRLDALLSAPVPVADTGTMFDVQVTIHGVQRWKLMDNSERIRPDRNGEWVRLADVDAAVESLLSAPVIKCGWKGEAYNSERECGCIYAVGELVRSCSSHRLAPVVSPPLQVLEYELANHGYESVRLCRMYQRDHSERWAIRRLGFTLNRDGEWESEPQPSSRDDDYMQRNRYMTITEALSVWASAPRGGGDGDK